MPCPDPDPGRTTTSRRRFLQITGAAALATALPDLRLLLAQTPSGAGVKFVDVRGGVGIFIGRGGTIGYCISGKKIAAVDSQFPQTAPVCITELAKRGESPFEFLINTHHHGDHTGGNADFRPVVGKIVGHENVPKYQRMQAKERGTGEPTVPDTTFAKEWKSKVGDENVRARHYGPAHTGGDAVITFESANVAHMGDLVFNGRHPFIDPPAGASMLNWPRVLEQAVKDHDEKTKYVFGHARVGLDVIGTKKEVFHFRDYLDAVNAHVKQGLEAGHDEEKILGIEKLEKFADFEGNARMNLRYSLTCSYQEQKQKAEKSSESRPGGN